MDELIIKLMEEDYKALEGKTVTMFTVKGEFSGKVVNADDSCVFLLSEQTQALTVVFTNQLTAMTIMPD